LARIRYRNVVAERQLVPAREDAKCLTAGDLGDPRLGPRGGPAVSAFAPGADGGLLGGVVRRG
jgi:hypothetical protein